jgi:hypothetical protein
MCLRHLQEKQQQAEVEKWAAALADAKGRLMEATRSNTGKLQTATQLMQRHKKLNAALLVTQAKMGARVGTLWLARC